MINPNRNISLYDLYKVEKKLNFIQRPNLSEVNQKPAKQSTSVITIGNKK